MMKPGRSRDQMLARRQRVISLLSWFNLFAAKGITSHNLSLTRLELEKELDSLEARLKGRRRLPRLDSQNSAG